jgi:hypothetical protein
MDFYRRCILKFKFYVFFSDSTALTCFLPNGSPFFSFLVFLDSRRVLGPSIFRTLSYVYFRIMISFFMIMELWYSVVIGSVIFAYIHLFNYNAKTYLEAQKGDSRYTHRESNPGQNLGRVSFYH